jgi:hypothetical protein
MGLARLKSLSGGGLGTILICASAQIKMVVETVSGQHFSVHGRPKVHF